MAGHACPTIAGTYLCCQKALGKLKEITHHLVEAESHHQREEEKFFLSIIGVN